MAADDSRNTIKEFKDAVNMTPKELERWLETEKSTGYASRWRIVELLGKKQVEYSDDDRKHIAVPGYPLRMNGVPDTLDCASRIAHAPVSY